MASERTQEGRSSKRASRSLLRLPGGSAAHAVISSTDTLTASRITSVGRRLRTAPRLLENSLGDCSLRGASSPLVAPTWFLCTSD